MLKKDGFQRTMINFERNVQTALSVGLVFDRPEASADSRTSGFGGFKRSRAHRACVRDEEWFDEQNPAETSPEATIPLLRRTAGLCHFSARMKYKNPMIRQ